LSTRDYHKLLALGTRYPRPVNIYSSVTIAEAFSGISGNIHSWASFPMAWLVENGYAVVMTIPPNVKHQELFLMLQREAREERRGLWR